MAIALASERKAAPATNRSRFLDACHCEAVDRPPVWMMRQAGRVLPEYRKLKEKYSFVELVRTPELAAEVTLQPIERFDFDAAIIFSDILVVPEALGQPYEFTDGAGIRMKPLDVAQLDALDASRVGEALRYVPDAIRLVRERLGNKTALLGFAGSPWTLANFMLEGGSAKQYAKAKSLFYVDRPRFDALMRVLTSAVVEFLQMQIEAGVDAVQIFDSHGGMLDDASFAAASGDWMTEIVTALRGRVPVILFSKGTHGNWDELARSGAQTISVDWTVNLREIRSLLPDDVGVQGNLDPAILTTTPRIVAGETRRLLDDARGLTGHIFNLGHGVPLNAPLENIQAMLDCIREFA